MTETAIGQRKLQIKWAKFRELNVLIAFLLLCLFFYWRRPDTFTKPANLAVIMRFIATFGMLAIGEVLVIITRGIDLSVGSMTAFTGVTTAWLMLKGVGNLLPPVGSGGWHHRHRRGRHHPGQPAGVRGWSGRQEHPARVGHPGLGA